VRLIESVTISDDRASQPASPVISVSQRAKRK
jgi:hypothetical protein